MNKIYLLSFSVFLLFTSLANGQERYQKAPIYYRQDRPKMYKQTRYGKPYKSVKSSAFKNLGNTNGFSLMANYEGFTGGLGLIWGANVGLNGAYILKRDRNVFSVSVGWYKFKPLSEYFASVGGFDEYDFDFDFNGTGSGGSKSYGKYNLIPVLVGYAYEIPLGKSGLSLLPGLDGGIRFASYSYTKGEGDEEEVFRVSQSQFTLAPKFEMEYHITGNFSITARSRYNIFFSDDENTESLVNSSNTRLSVTNGIGVVFYF
ncbi:hypothetical protein R9C00_11455 [Flammeovirgaceae bacterium SG7u.111]|nr:hypothetical protein [Flammeovirgaceae bacterium SG7u.132]WPO38068.1 hypothetical protein R9C00_11455 [Flammeovirgaceae bacterium SG7u.111]